MKKRVFFVLIVFALRNLCAEEFLSAAETGHERRLAIASFVESLHIPGASERLNELRRNKKCGFEVNAFLQSLMSQLSPDKQDRLRRLLATTDLQTFRLIGHFEIHYDTTGANQPALIDSNGNRIPNSYEAYIDSVGTVFNHTWSIEVDSLHYPPPPFLPGHAGYVVDVLELSTELYGQTEFENQLNGSAQPALYSTHIEIDNDYVGYYSPGIAGLKVTSAHELHHAIAVGNFGYWAGQVYYYEICATWMETVVYPEVPDYIAYLEAPDGSPRGGFEFPWLSFTTADGITEFSHVVWGKYIEKRYSRGMMRDVWNYVPSAPILTAIDAALTDAGSSFREAFLEWSRWNYYTGSNADTVNYYTEGNIYPNMLLRSVDQYTPPGRSLQDSIEVLSSTYHPILVGNNTMVSVISNINTSSTGTPALLNFTYEMSDQGGAGFKQLSNGIYVRIDVPDPQNWSSWENVPTQTSIVIVYPDPFIAQSHKPLNFRLPSAIQSTAVLHVFTSSMRLVYDNEVPVVNLRPLEPGIVWDAHDKNGNLIASGIYFYVIEIDQNVYNGKFAVLRE